MRTRTALASVVVAVAASFSTPAHAAPEEIQVYIDDLNRICGAGVDFHVNYVPVGSGERDYPAQQSNLRRFRVTPEFSYGVTDHVEVGLYLPLATIDRTGRADAHGVKARVKFIGSNPGDRVFWGANLEAGYEDRALAVNPGNAELKLIGGVHAGKWLIASNFNVDFAYAGRRPDPVAFDFDTRVSREVAKGLQLGVETYNGVGDARHFGNLSLSDQATYAVADIDLGHDFGLNLGAGYGYGGNHDHLVLKAIVSVPFGHRSRGEPPKVGAPEQ